MKTNYSKNKDREKSERGIVSLIKTAFPKVVVKITNDLGKVIYDDRNR